MHNLSHIFFILCRLASSSGFVGGFVIAGDPVQFIEMVRRQHEVVEALLLDVLQHPLTDHAQLRRARETEAVTNFVRDRPVHAALGQVVDEAGAGGHARGGCGRGGCGHVSNCWC